MRSLGVTLALLLAGCAQQTSGRPEDPALSGLGLQGLVPELVLPGTRITVTGESFVPEDWGDSTLVLSADGADELRLPLVYVDAHTLALEVDAATFEALGGDGAELDANASVEVKSAVDDRIYRTGGLDVELALVAALDPRIDQIQAGGVIFPNEPLAVVGSGLLLEGEGTTVAVVSGCFTPTDASECTPAGPIEVPLVGVPGDRTHGTFAFAPEIAGILPGHFTGEVLLRNQHAGGEQRDSVALAVEYDLERPIVYGASTNEASLGRYVIVTGGGFVGGDGTTLLEFDGSFVVDDTGEELALEVALLPELVDGHTVRYVVNENDALGQSLDVRYQSGTFAGTVTPRIEWQGTESVGDPAPFSFHLGKVRQIVYVSFLPAYVESLRAFGLRAVEDRLRARIFDVLRQDFATIGVEVRETVPDDYAYYAQVDVGGPDPNGLGLLGYDNTHGKDTDNLRLYDRIGGVNALTQQDGYPGYGGVFIESLFGYSEHPGQLAESSQPDPRFDALFDPFRPDRGGHAVGEADLAGDDVPMLGNGDECPAKKGDRPQQIACAVWALGSMIGTTVSHELGHSLGLADPYGPDFHDAGEEDDRLMDADRPFAERAVLGGEGPSRFCDEEYLYLRAILPTDEPADPQPRPRCD